MSRYRILLNISFIFLVLTKSVFFILIVPGLLYLADYNFRSLLRYKYEILLTVLLVGIYLYLQNYFFTENFPIRTAHPEDTTVKDFSFSHFIPRFREYFLSLDRAIFFFFPPLVFSFRYWKKFYNDFKSEALLFVGSFLFFSLVALHFHIYGDWCFGPRYYIFILPLVSMPCFYFFNLKSKLRFLFLLSAITYSFFQFNYTQKNFHFSYRLSGAFSKLGVETNEFDKNKLLVSRDLSLYYLTGEHPALEQAIEQQVSGLTYIKLKEQLDVYRCDLVFDVFCI